MRKYLTVAATAAALMAGSAAFAGHFYASPAIGFGGMDTQSKLEGTTTSYKLRGFAWRVDAGYLFNVSPGFNAGAELGYNGYADNKYGNSSSQQYEYKGHTIDLLAVGQYQFTGSHFDVHGKLGAAAVSQKTEGAYLTTMQESKTRVKPEAAIGFGYAFSKNIGLNLDYYHVFGSTPDVPGASASTKGGLNKTASVNLIMLGLNYNFV